MAGGMGGRRRGLPMHERVALTSGRDRVSPAGSPDESCPARHCWVLDPADKSGVKRAALLVAWRRSRTGAWEGQVVYLGDLRGPGEWAVVCEWVPERLLSPA